MKLIFDWCQSFYETKTQWHGDTEIISLDISQNECGFAIAKISVIAKSTDDLLNKKYAKIGLQLDEKNPKIDLIFSGRLVSFPLKFGNSCLQLEIIAEPDDYQNQLAEFSRKNMELYKTIDKHQQSENLTKFDDLFYCEKDLNNPTIFLEGNNKIFYWNMRTGKLSLSDINNGNRNIEVNGNIILENSLHVRLAREPYKSVNVSVSANWIQYSDGYIDLYPIIANYFQGGVINSFTNIKSGIENLCKFSYKNGYRLVQCKINESVPIKNIQYFQRYPLVSRDFIIPENEHSKQAIVRFKRFYFSGKMLVNWSYKQKRTEIANVKIVNSNAIHGREKTVHLKLNSIQLPRSYQYWNLFTYYGCGEKVLYKGFVFECKESHFSGDNFVDVLWKKIEKIPDALLDDSQGSFFKTERGKNAIKYAIQKAVSLINYSSRYVEISFTVAAKDFLSVSIDDQMTIVDSRFQNGRITGKVIKTRFIASANQKIIRISIACTLNNIVFSNEKIQRYFNGLTFKDDEIIINPEDIVDSVEIINDPEKQEQLLLLSDAKTISELESLLKKHPTKIRVKLHPLNTMRVINRDINLPDFNI